MLGSREREDLQAHLSGCEACSRQLGQLRALDGLLASERLEAPEALVQRVMAQARAEGLGSAPRWVQLADGIAPLLSYTAVAAMACAVAWRVAAQWTQAPPSFVAHLTRLPASEVTALAVLALGGAAAVVSWLASQGAEAAV